jgi:WD40 repeat protein
MFVWNAHDGAVTSLAFGPDGQRLFSGGSDECVKAWQPFTGAEQFRISLAPEDRSLYPPVPLHWLTVSGDGNWGVVYQFSRRLVFFDLARERIADEYEVRQIHALKRTPDSLGVAALIPGPSYIAWPLLHSYDFAAQTALLLPLRHYSSTSRALAFSTDGSRVAVGSRVHPWPVTDHRGTAVYTKSYEPEDLAFSADNEHLFALVGGKVAVYSLTTSLFKTKLKGHCGQITAMQLSPDGRRLWTASRDATVKCWDTHSLTLDRTFRFDTGGLDCLAVSPDGNVAAVGSGRKGTITVWDLS